MNEPIFTQFSYPSANGRDNIAAYLWAPEAPRAIVQLSHGMQEYIQRYAPFIRFLCARGYAVGGNDHLGHGNTAATADDLGFTGEGGGADAMVNDLHTMTAELRERLPGLPVILVGHSMGSFVARCAAAAYSADYDAAIFIGTAGTDLPTAAGKLLARWRMFRRGERHRSQLLAKVMFSGYNRRYEEPTTPKSWISRDTAVVEAYMQDKFCNFAFTARGFYDLFTLLERVSAKDWAEQIPDGLPVLLTSGEMDPVGGFGRGVKQVYDRLSAAGVRDLTLKLYPDARHEILNEINRDVVYADILAWLDARFGEETDNA
ncbi:MAG: alpha/beta fold hydrolase [Clostridia bacterium]|nr:alpha/beta fold hydrolase [Clostridia bacterium]